MAKIRRLNWIESNYQTIPSKRKFLIRSTQCILDNSLQNVPKMLKFCLRIHYPGFFQAFFTAVIVIKAQFLIDFHNLIFFCFFVYSTFFDVNLSTNNFYQFIKVINGQILEKTKPCGPFTILMEESTTQGNHSLLSVTWQF